MSLRSLLAASVPFGIAAVLLLAGCNRAPLGVAPAPTVVPAVASAPAPSAAAATGSAPAFSLPIGGNIAPAPPTSATYTPPPLNPVPAASGPIGPIATADSPSAPAPNQPLPPGQPQAGPTSPAPGSFAAGQGTAIRLSAGIAVPQSLPGGTVMGISVDYSANAALNRSSQYVWVIKSAAGEIRSEVKLDASGNLSAFFQQLKPEHRPFSARIEEVPPGSERRIVVSNELALKTDY